MIGGNIIGKIYQKVDNGLNEIGEKVIDWEITNSLKGWLDLASGSSERSLFDTKIQNSTHIFICDYVDVDRKVENKKMVINNLEYDILLIDNPMELNQHLEIYLKFIGGQK